MELTYDTLVPRAVLLTSLLLLIFSATQFGLTAHSIKTIDSQFPQDSYAWYGPVGYAFDNYEDTKFASLRYHWTTENLVYVSAGLSIAAGAFGLLAWVSRGWVKMANRDEWEPRSVWNDVHIAAVIAAVLAFITTLVCTIWAGIINGVLAKGACSDNGFRGSFTCTRELAVCHIVPYLVRRSERERSTACAETKASRGLMIPEVILSFVLAVSYAGHIYYTRKHAALDRRATGRAAQMQRPEVAEHSD